MKLPQFTWSWPGADLDPARTWSGLTWTRAWQLFIVSLSFVWLLGVNVFPGFGFYAYFTPTSISHQSYLLNLVLTCNFFSNDPSFTVVWLIKSQTWSQEGHCRIDANNLCSVLSCYYFATWHNITTNLLSKLNPNQFGNQCMRKTWSPRSQCWFRIVFVKFPILSLTQLYWTWHKWQTFFQSN